MEPRSRNFSSEEINMLLTLVSEKKHILECKTTDKYRPEEKEKVWNGIERDFNANSGVQYRSMKVLRTKYINLKSDLKKRAAEKKRSLYGTGGGPPLVVPNCDFDKMLNDIIPEKQIDGITSRYDKDRLNQFEETEDVEILYSNVFDSPTTKEAGLAHEEVGCEMLGSKKSKWSEAEDFENISPQANVSPKRKEPRSRHEKEAVPWENYTPQDLKTPKNNKLSLASKTPKQTSWEKLAATKEKWSEEKLRQEVNFFKSEHELRTLHLKELHKLDVELKELHKRNIMEKHNIEMEILKNKLNDVQ